MITMVKINSTVPVLFYFFFFLPFILKLFALDLKIPSTSKYHYKWKLRSSNLKETDNQNEWRGISTSRFIFVGNDTYNIPEFRKQEEDD